ncbi:unnamed protein product [Zymoseptoria tritici ST99CH_3D1]|uniref:Tat pathway signal sequence n=2 Tax=Zymoseptoria tritici TaxID=1047171 RepID=A0A1X7RUH9_ZYMT9|nr:unnamed protein product [Zymoseptoria tritici ST99CH_3D7]SMR52956.1 unnamed protein product [Zymoseptoria tritici ST99CH_1E4]SMR54433.1 unnamed protein product [Zymoseptoria tritici ST99CH_3D1]
MNALLLEGLRGCRPTNQIPEHGQVLYSPAMGVLQHQSVVFKGMFSLNSSAYSGPPTKESNAKWEELYSFGISAISTKEASQMINHTLPIPGQHGSYITSLSVFHMLHCLNVMRHAIYEGPDWLDIDELMAISHVDHCINAIRQSLMCSADITPLVWARQRHDGKVKEVMEVVHSCRNFDLVRQWGLQRQLKTDFDRDRVVTSDPLGWGSTSIP